MRELALSEFGRRFAVSTGIGRLMEDLGEARRDSGLSMLGGGNPARVPGAVDWFRRFALELVEDDQRFASTLGLYDPPRGNRAFIEAVAELLRGCYGWDIGPGNVVLSPGSQAAFFILFNLFAGRFAEGGPRRVLLPLAPEYVGYAGLGLTAGIHHARRARIETIDDHLFKYHPELEDLDLSDGIGAICVSRPTNPTGNLLMAEEMAALDAAARRQGIPLIVDAAYGLPFPGIVFEDDLPAWNDNTVLCLSLSKLGLPAARTGIVIANEAICEAVARVQGTLFLAPGGIGPALTTELLRGGRILEFSRELIQPFYRARALKALGWLREALAGLPFRVHKPEGTFFLWVWFEGLPIPSHELYLRLKSRGVLVVPGESFFPGLEEDGWQHKRECIRINYGQDEAAVERGIGVLAKEVRALYG
jgi:valine--pyruvate aminotransferase